MFHRILLFYGSVSNLSFILTMSRIVYSEMKSYTNSLVVKHISFISTKFTYKHRFSTCKKYSNISTP